MNVLWFVIFPVNRRFTFPSRETQNTGFVYNCWKQAVIFGYHNRQESEKHKNVEKNIYLDGCKILPGVIFRRYILKARPIAVIINKNVLWNFLSLPANKSKLTREQVWRWHRGTCQGAPATPRASRARSTPPCPPPPSQSRPPRRPSTSRARLSSLCLCAPLLLQRFSKLIAPLRDPILRIAQ